ncbi:MAG: rod shape-determining protein MreC [Desulforegulaceae bacterium]|nr:rod shape-determining protein MreC [Desulforegulaceae bacterium]
MFSRKKIIKPLIVIFLFINISALIAAGRGGGKIQGLGAFGLDLFGPIEKFIVTGSRNLNKIWDNYFALVHVRGKNSQLEKELKYFQARETKHSELMLENERLRELLKFGKKLKSEYIAAEVVGRDSGKWFDTIILNRGRKSGVLVSCPVIVPEGIVGQVVSVSKNYSKVLLVTDRMSGVDCLVQSSRGRGVVSGTGENICLFKYFLRKFEVKPGDHLITSGMDKIFPKGLRVGEVINVKRRDSGIFQDVEVRPFVDFERLEEVLILFNPSPERKDG